MLRHSTSFGFPFSRRRTANPSAYALKMMSTLSLNRVERRGEPAARELRKAQRQHHGDGGEDQDDDGPAIPEGQRQRQRVKAGRDVDEFALKLGPKLESAREDILAPIARARSLLNGGMASSLGLHPAARRHRRIVAPQTAGVDVKRPLRIASTQVAVEGSGRPLSAAIVAASFAGRDQTVRNRQCGVSYGPEHRTSASSVCGVAHLKFERGDTCEGQRQS